MPEVRTLDNGLRVVVTQVPHARSVAISVYMATGARHEAPQEAGLSHFVEHLCFKGTERRPLPQDIAVEVDALGGGMNAATEREFTVYYARVTEEHAERAMDLLADIVRHSLFAQPEIERERGVILEELAAVEDSPDEQAGILLDGLLWPGQAHGRDIAGSPQTVQSITPSRLVDFYRQQYVANAAVVSIAGALPEQAAMALVERALGDWSWGEPAGWSPAREEPHGARSQAIVKQTEQAHLSLGMRGLSAVDDDRYAADLLSALLGDGMSSRLFSRLREELGLCYDIHTFTGYLRDAGMFGVYAGVDPDKAREAVCEIVGELSRVREPVPHDELRRAQEMARTRLQLRMEDTRAVAGWYGAQEVLDLPRLSPDEAIARSDAVTVEDVQRVAARLFNDERLHLAVVGPFEGLDLLDGVSLGG